MTEKVYKDVLPCGVLTTRTGEKYWLIKPEPVVRDSWQHDQQQRFLVVPYVEIGVNFAKDFLYYGYARHLITTNPDIEYRYETEPIKVWTLEQYDATEELSDPDLDDYPVIEEPDDFSHLDDEVYMEALGADLDE